MENIQLLELQNSSKTQTNSDSLANLTDKDLLSLCQKYGTQAILWKRKFIGLLPEVDRRELYLKKGCASIYEFAAKFGGVTNEQVKRVISIDKKLSELELFELREKLINGEVSLNKLARIVSVANGDNEMVLADAMKKLSQGSLETFVKDEKNRQMAELLGVNDSAVAGDGLWPDLPEGNGRHLRGTENSCENMFVRTHKQDYEMNGVVAQVGGGREGVEDGQVSGLAGLRDLQELGLDSEVIQRLKKLKEQGRDINKVMNEMLDKREENIAEQKAETVRKVTDREKKRKAEGKKPAHTARSLPCEVRWRSQPLLKEEFGTKCAVGGCNKAATQIHHTVPFSINGSNSPDLLKPLCRAHHDIVHSVNARYLEKKGVG